MVLLPSLISLRHPSDTEPTPEDIFSSSLGSIFTDDTQNQHGTDPATTILYSPSNPVYPTLELRTANPDGEEERRKFAHYLWNAGVLMGELVGGRPVRGSEEHSQEGGLDEVDDGRWKDGEWWLHDEEEENTWSVKGEKVLELGAGVGLGGIMSALGGAVEVVITDYPSPSLLSVLRLNTVHNLPPSLQSLTSIHPHLWGSFTDSISGHNVPHDGPPPHSGLEKNAYTAILSADCLWLSSQHINLYKSMLYFLSHAREARVLVIAGFHTGRARVASFFEEVVGSSVSDFETREVEDGRVEVEAGTLEGQGKATTNEGKVEWERLVIERIYEMDVEGRRREWMAERDGGREDVTGRKRWLVVAVLKRG